MTNKTPSMESNKIPVWMVTFADLMALMMTFFVLLYSFSKIDADKYKSVVDSMAKGFDGVQWIKRHLVEDDIIGPEPGVIAPPINIKPQEKRQQEAVEPIQKTIPQPKPQPTQSEIIFSKISLDLEKEISAGLLYVQNKGDKVVIRFPEKVSFTSGSYQLVEDFIPVIHRISAILRDSQGKIMIAGHTDDRPISTERLRSNWELSSSRATSVAHRLLETQLVDSQRVVVMGHADTQPLVPNDSAEARAKNRRVEIVIFKSEE